MLLVDKLIGFGASTVEGACDPEGGFLHRLDKKLADAGHPHQCLNFGIGGNTTRDMLARIKRVRPHLPARAILLLGSNDIPREADVFPDSRVPLDEFSRNVWAILDEFAGSDAIFVSSFAVCTLRTGILPHHFADYMKTALDIVATRKLRTWDLYSESLNFQDRYLADDGLHYNGAGHEMMAGRLLEMMR